MSESDLDRLVKGAPPPGKDFPIPTTTPVSELDGSTPGVVSDPLASLPSSPPQIYLNLLILEASLRAQWLQLRTRRRQHTFFLTLLGLWNLYFGYALFLAPREDGSGVGGSVYWVVEVAEKVCLMGGIVTGILVWGTGQWERGIRRPRRWLWNTNRGIRGFNCKLVVIHQSWWRELLSALSFFLSYGLFVSNSGSSYRFVAHSLHSDLDKGTRTGGHQGLPNIHEDDDPASREEDLSPGGDCVKLLLLPKPFTPTFRENWDIYRTEYWEKENERRTILRKKVKELDIKEAKRLGGWFWWTGYRGWKRRISPDLEKVGGGVHRQSSVEKDNKRTRGSSLNSGSHSRNSSRSSTPALDLDDGITGGHSRSNSSASNASERRKKRSATGKRVQKLTSGGASAPDVHSPLARNNSFTSVSSMDSERPGTPGDGDSVRSLRDTRSQANPARKGSGKAVAM